MKVFCITVLKTLDVRTTSAAESLNGQCGDDLPDNHGTMKGVLARIRQLKRSQVKILAGATSAVRACLEVCRRVAAVTARRHHTPWKDIQVGHTSSYGGEAR